METRRLLVVSHSLSGGGAERFTSLLLSHLPRDRWSPSLLVCRGERTYPIPDDVPVQVVGPRGALDLPASVLRCAQELRRQRPDVILSTMDYTTLLVGLALKTIRKAQRPRWVARLALNTDRPPFSLRDRWSRPLLRWVYRDVDHFVANARGLATTFAQQHRLPADRVRAIHNPVDVHALRTQAAEAPAIARDRERKLIVWVGRLHRQKRPDLALAAYAKLCCTFAVDLWLLGDGPLRASLDQEIESRGWRDQVRLLGYQANPFPLVAQADLFLLTSDHEGLPNALLESQALGIPAVATRCPFGPEEIVLPGATGTLVPCGDATAIAEAAAELLADDALLARYREQASADIAPRFAPQPIITAWEQALFPGA